VVKPENKDTLTKILIYDVVAGRMSAADRRKQIKASHGMAATTIRNVFQSKGVIQVVDSVLTPN
jgi:uncharacterized surface protein with fasciclin (FAS1) repeats